MTLDTKKGKVLLTGASGFIAFHVLDQLLKKGYTVKATVRSQEKADFIANRYKDYGDKLQFAIVKDIQNEEEFDELFKNDTEITKVIHTASPFYIGATDPKHFLDPAVNGTKNVLKSIKKYAPQVDHVVITSSFAAIVDTSRVNDHSLVLTEKSWNPITWEIASSDVNQAYRGSKTFAEKALWDFIEQEKPNFVGTTVNPPYVFGPIIHQVESADKINTSNAFIYKFANSPEKVDPSTFQDLFLWVDVRDVAAAHILAIERPEADNQRWLVSDGYHSPQLIFDIINKHFPEYKSDVGKPGTGLDKLNETYQFDNSVTNKQSGLVYHTLEESVVDTINSFKALNL